MVAMKHCAARGTSSGAHVTYTAPLLETENVAPTPADTNAAPAPVTEYVTPTPTDFYAATARVIEYVAPAPVIEHIAPPPAVTCFALCQQLPPETMATVTTDVSSDTTGFVNPQFSSAAVEASASHVIGPLPSWMSLLCLCTTKSVRNRSLQSKSACNSAPLNTCQSLRSRSRSVESVQVIPQELFSVRIEEQIVDILVPPIVGEMAEVVQVVPQEYFQQRTVEQIVGAPVPQVVEEQLVAEQTTQTSVEIRKQVEYVAPAPAASFAALDPAVLDGFQQALVRIGASDLDTLTEQQLDAAIEVILQYSKQSTILLENAQKLYDLSEAKLGDLLRVQQAFATQSGTPLKCGQCSDGTAGSPGRDTNTGQDREV